MENFYQFGALISAITFSGAGIFIKKINTRNFFSIPFYEGLFSIMIMLLIISLLYNWQDTLSGNSSSIIINFILAATLSSTGRKTLCEVKNDIRLESQESTILFLQQNYLF